LAGAGAAGVGAATVPNPFYGSDTVFNVIRDSIKNAVSTGTPAFPVSLGPSQSANYIAGGSGAGQNAMIAANAHQQIAPMSKPMSACKAFGGTDATGAAMNNGSGIVLGLDAVDIVASVEVGASTSCSSASGTTQDLTTGLVHNSSSAFGSNSLQNWKWVLALVYGGLDYNTGTVDCGQNSRRQVVNNWTQLFQNGCTNNTTRTNACGDTAHLNGGDGTNVPLWHAFRRDDASGTSDVFSQLIGISSFVGASDSAVNGFGTSPYCNAINWDTNTENKNASGTGCNAGPHDQWVGPGGIVDSQSTWTFAGFGNAETNGAAGSGNHRRPPPGTWGDGPDPNSNKVSSADVLPTSHQDNDPIRRPCLGTGAGNLSAENVCNLDGKLGVVLSLPASDFITDPALNGLGTAGVQYPTVACDNSFLLAAAPAVYNCAPFNINNASPSKHSGQCENGDLLSGANNQCYVPINVANNTSACLAKKSTFNGVTKNVSLPAVDGRAYNIHMRDGDTTDGAIAYWHIPIFASATATISRDFTGGMGRIHSQHVVFGGGGGTPPAGLVACQMLDVTDELGCLAQADACSIAYAGDGSTTWNSRSNQGGITNPGGTVTGAMRVDGMNPNPTTVQASASCSSGTCGTAPTSTQFPYPMARKLYVNSAVGFQNVLAQTAGDSNVTGEIQLAEYLSDPTGTATGVATPINTVMTNDGFFNMGPLNSAAGSNATFCEDYNQVMICNSGSGTNDNACSRNPSGIVGATGSTTCGNGTLEAFEECDDGPTQSGSCSTTCRCKGKLRFTGIGSATSTRCVN
jgi:cysteine-rich repeat protein